MCNISTMNGFGIIQPFLTLIQIHACKQFTTIPDKNWRTKMNVVKLAINDVHDLFKFVTMFKSAA